MLERPDVCQQMKQETYKQTGQIFDMYRTKVGGRKLWAPDKVRVDLNLMLKR